MSGAYDREEFLRARLNTFLREGLRLSADDYYLRLNLRSLGELKSVLSDIDNIITMKVSLAFADLLSETLELSVSTVIKN